MKFIFKIFMSLHIFLYRISSGNWASRVAGLSILLLTTTGRKSGKEITTPLGYFEDGGNYVIIASNGGRPSHPSWFLNLSQNPKVSIQIKNQTIIASAQVAQSADRERLWSQLIQISPMYEKYRTSTPREIPVVMLRPASAK